MDALKQSLDLLWVQVFIDGLAMGGILDDQSEWEKRYWVRLRMSFMNFYVPAYLAEHDDYYIKLWLCNLLLRAYLQEYISSCCIWRLS